MMTVPWAIMVAAAFALMFVSMGYGIGVSERKKRLNRRMHVCRNCHLADVFWKKYPSCNERFKTVEDEKDKMVAKRLKDTGASMPPPVARARDSTSWT